MITWAAVRRWDGTALGGVADALNDRCARLVAAGDGLAEFDGWTGDAAGSAAARGTALTAALEQWVAEASAVRRAAHEAQVVVERLSAHVRETEELALRNGFRIDDGGRPTALPSLAPPAVRRRAQQELADRVEQILRQAAEADADFAAVLTRAANGQITDQGPATSAQAVDASAALGGPTMPAPPPGGTPGDNRAWWDGLPDTVQAAVLRDAPDLVRNLDGIPVVDRDAANRVVLQRETSRWQGDPSEAAKAKRRGLEAIRTRLDAAGPGQPRAYLVGLDTGGQGRAIVAAGNPDTSVNVATSVPGTGSELSKIGGDLDRSDKMWRSATMAGSPSTSVITWLGYDAPDQLWDAASEKYADNGKAALSGFEDGLRASHDGPPSHNTVVGHSYGTTVVGHAARDGGLNADDVIFVASPGVGVDHANELHLDGVSPQDVGRHVHSTVAEHDLIRLSNLGLRGHDVALGPSPADADFGGRVFASAPGTEGPWYEGGLSGAAHSQYWEDNNPALRSFGRIIAGLDQRRNAA
ncbi:alpha/beta hydrolase [Amycolatopsis sp. PS_44_ISF1]|uniref:alpha/beta hydrolase n=1 Tax=Amycolatopsis sp. PS_44_ISF1 TaxID=2974917 RepID=UPI0028DD747F|nr:alpha/beta hydrolase [Amycolatopsis sp. PS_44_ISF1]MDT8915920.1 alpha/beta hydrolase family protein [Amycolatopsis sp. PS_44_ISF1]